MKWPELRVAECGTHHIDEKGCPAYEARFLEVLKFHSPGLAPVLSKEMAWHIHGDGSAAYERRFFRTFGFYEDLAAVVSAEGWHHICAEGKDAYAARYSWCGNFQGGRSVVRSPEGAYFHITPDGSAAYGKQWHYAGDYRDGFAVVQAQNGLSTHVHLDGSFLHDRWFLDLDVFHKGFARARDEGGWTHVDHKGRAIYTRRFHAVEPFYNGQARVERFDGALEVIDEAGTTQVLLRPARESEFSKLSADMVGFWRTQTIAAAVKLGVIEALPARLDQIAKHCDLQVDKARRLLWGLAELNLLECQDGCWSLSSRGELLQKEHPLSLADAAIEYAGPFSAMWSQLPDAIRRGTAWSAGDVFEEVGRDEARRLGHHRMLRSYARHDYAQVVETLDLRGSEKVVDAGGGLGVLAELIVERHPGVELTVVERPEVVDMAPPHSRVRWLHGSLFEEWDLKADVVLLCRVLHDWDDEKALQILQQARKALPQYGRLFILEMLLSKDSAAGALCDLHLLMVTGGRERRAEEFRRLLAAAGFQLVEIRKTSALPSLIVAVAS